MSLDIHWNEFKYQKWKCQKTDRLLRCVSILLKQVSSSSFRCDANAIRIKLFVLPLNSLYKLSVKGLNRSQKSNKLNFSPYFWYHENGWKIFINTYAFSRQTFFLRKRNRTELVFCLRTMLIVVHVTLFTTFICSSHDRVWHVTVAFMQWRNYT